MACLASLSTGLRAPLRVLNGFKVSEGGRVCCFALGHCQ